MSLIILILNYFLSLINLNSIREKKTSFECGFELFRVSRLPFSIHFYLIGILFLIFDVEIVLLFPLINSLRVLNFFNWFYSSIIILLILYLGLEFEINSGVLK